MVIIMRPKRLRQMLKDSYEKGVTKGYELGYQMRQVEDRNRGFIIGSKIDRQLDEILKQKGGKQ